MLNDQSFAILADGFPPSLISLDISKNENLTIESYQRLNAMPLKFLFIEQNGITDDDLRAIIEIKQDMSGKQGPKPDKLFVNNQININAICKIVEKSVEELKKNKSMKPSKILATYPDIVNYFKLTGLVTSLRHLSVSKNKITDIGAKYLYKLMLCSRELQTLLIHWN